MNLETVDEAIGIFDSGVGGISVLWDIQKLLPHEHLFFFGDNAYAPYGTKEPEVVRSRCMDIIQMMLDLPVKAVVIACNTASSVAAKTIREQVSIPVIAMEPALKPAHEIRHGGKILVLATPVTLALPKFKNLYEQYGEGAEAIPCPGLMDLVEQENMDEAEQYLKRIFSQYDPDELDAVVLGCTHYVFLKKMARSLLPGHTAVIDGNYGTARQLKRVLEEKHLLRSEGEGCVELHTSGDEEIILPRMHRLMQKIREIDN
ncbi:MAG: glutamate racemase [Clostridia bacterium]|jgi:glutamate racemase|nr:glutamate racemase [Clostridia bacterium]